MMKHTDAARLVTVALLGAVSLGCTGGDAAVAAAARADSALVARHLMIFDTLDYVAFRANGLDRFKESHAPDIIVTFPDGRETHGLEAHLVDMRAMFAMMPDLAINEHPIKIGHGPWTSVVGRMTGTFTQPMALGNGKFMQPNGKKLDLTMSTVAHWNEAGLMDHEWLFWDNHTYMTQLGLIP